MVKPYANSDICSFKDPEKDIVYSITASDYVDRIMGMEEILVTHKEIEIRTATFKAIYNMGYPIIKLDDSNIEKFSKKYIKAEFDKAGYAKIAGYFGYGRLKELVPSISLAITDDFIPLEEDTNHLAIGDIIIVEKETMYVSRIDTDNNRIFLEREDPVAHTTKPLYQSIIAPALSIVVAEIANKMKADVWDSDNMMTNYISDENRSILDSYYPDQKIGRPILVEDDEPNVVN